MVTHACGVCGEPFTDEAYRDLHEAVDHDDE